MKRFRIHPVWFVLILAVCTALSPSAAGYSFALTDPAGDDKGPGTYVYPTDSVFYRGAFDMTGFQVTTDGGNLVFKITMATEIVNSWGGPNGVSVQLFQVYIDKDHKPGSGFTECIPGANVSFDPASAWDFGMIIEGGWGQEVENQMAAKAEKAMQKVLHVVHTGSVAGKVLTFTVPLAVVGEPTDTWGYQVFCLGQEGSSEADVVEGIKVRKIYRKATQWQFGGGDESGYAPNIIDMFTGEGQDQYTLLNSYSPADDAFATVSCLYK